MVGHSPCLEEKIVRCGEKGGKADPKVLVDCLSSEIPVADEVGEVTMLVSTESGTKTGFGAKMVKVREEEEETDPCHDPRILFIRRLRDRIGEF